MKMNEIDLSSVFADLRTLNYTTIINNVETTVTAYLWDSAINELIPEYFNMYYGLKKADVIAEKFNNGDISAVHLSSLIRTIYDKKWAKILECWTSVYNPLDDQNIKEVRIIDTDYGKITTKYKGSNTTTEQLTAGSNSTTYGHKITSSYGDLEETEKVATFDSNANVDDSSSKTTKGNDTVAHSDTDTTITNLGKIKVENGGNDHDDLSGTDTITDTFSRHGSIIAIQELLTKEVDFWERFSFFKIFFADIARLLSLPMYEEA